MACLVLFRHGKSLKNEQDRHGGPGTSLIAEAEAEISMTANRLKDIGIRPLLILTAPVPQAIETANLLGAIWEVKVLVESLLEPLNFGVLAGLSRQEAKIQYPCAAEQMEKWRRGELEICQLILPEAEDYKAFYARGQRFLRKYSDLKQDLLVVGTRSILICLVSILIGRTIELGGGYREIPISCCEYFLFRIINGSYRLDTKSSNCVFSKEL